MHYLLKIRSTTILQAFKHSLKTHLSAWPFHCRLQYSCMCSFKVACQLRLRRDCAVRAMRVGCKIRTAPASHARAAQSQTDSQLRQHSDGLAISDIHSSQRYRSVIAAELQCSFLCRCVAEPSQRRTHIVVRTSSSRRNRN
jgi:hypothetical protein